MSKSLKIVLWIILAVVVVGGIIFSARRKASAPSSYPPGVIGNNNPASSANDISDASLNQDLANMDSQLGGLGADSASIDNGLNDQPLPVQ